MEAFITIDFTKTEDLLKHIQDQTTNLRNQIILKRSINQPSITYRVKFPSINVVRINGNILYQTSDQANKQKSIFQGTARQKISGEAEVTISTKSIYPFQIGFVKTGVINKTVIQQACKIKINNQVYILTGINYPNVDNPEDSLIHWLGILVAEQIRFNTIQVYQKYGIYDTAYQLYKTLFYNFKSKNDIYNSWQKNWQTKAVVIYSTKGAQVGKGQVKKLLKRI